MRIRIVIRSRRLYRRPFFKKLRIQLLWQNFKISHKMGLHPFDLPLGSFRCHRLYPFFKQRPAPLTIVSEPTRSSLDILHYHTLNPFPTRSPPPGCIRRSRLAPKNLDIIANPSPCVNLSLSPRRVPDLANFSSFLAIPLTLYPFRLRANMVKQRRGHACAAFVLLISVTLAKAVRMASHMLASSSHLVLWQPRQESIVPV